MELHAVTGLLYIVDGQYRDSASVPGLMAQSAPSGSTRGRDHDHLFIHLSAIGDLENIEVFYQDLLDNLSATFYRTPGSLTAALRKSILDTNQLLLQHNLSGLGAAIEGAITCAVQHGHELFIAQAGEAFALVGHNFGIERLSPTPQQQATPLGRTAGVDIRLSHSRIVDGDMILLADPRLAHLSTHSLSPVLIEVSVDEGLNELGQLVGSDSTRAILVEFTDEAPAHLPDAERSHSSKASARILPLPTSGPIRETRPTQPPSTQLAAAGALRNIDVESVETSARKVTSKAALSASKGTGWFADLLSKVRSPDRPEDNATNLAIPAIIALAIPIIVAVVVAGVYIQRGQVALLSNTKTEIRQLLNQADQSADPGQAELFYKEALSKISEAEDIRSGDRDIATMYQQAGLGLDNLVGVARLSSLPIYRFDNDTMLSSIVVDEGQLGSIYVLDTQNDRVYRLSTDELFQALTNEPETIVSREQIVGSFVVGPLVDMMWRPAGNQVTRDGLAVLDQRGALVSYFSDFSDLRAVTLDLASQWKTPSSVADFSERLYVLDQGSSAIWRYFAEGEGFTIIDEQQSIEFVDEADLEHVVDMAIYSEDGSLILLYDDGRLRRYTNGRLLWQESDLQANGLASPMISPVAVKIIGRGLNSSVYVADPASDRIIQLSLGGTFLAQYKASDEAGNELFGQITDFTVAGNPFRIVVVTSDGVYSVGEE
ncbi:MAG TPA: hypothetical protein VMZ24_03885 [Patescibacteria group bacterium]|nr:hypothetical protein [Patescibacteria group bacterium]